MSFTVSDCILTDFGVVITFGVGLAGIFKMGFLGVFIGDNFPVTLGNLDFVMKIQKYKWMKNMPTFNEYVKQLKEKYSVCDAARTLKMHYSQLHSLLSCKKTTWLSSVTMCKEKCDKLLLRQ